MKSLAVFVQFFEKKLDKIVDFCNVIFRLRNCEKHKKRFNELTLINGIKVLIGKEEMIDSFHLELSGFSISY